jgi:hypothetical protein
LDCFDWSGWLDNLRTAEAAARGHGRHWVIAIGGLGGILWSKFIDSPKRVGSGIIKMSHYKAGPKENEGKFPHHVDMMAPESGFGSRLNAMHDWHDARSIEAVRGLSRHENGRYIIRWCFASLVTAALFQKEFGEGQRE